MVASSSSSQRWSLFVSAHSGTPTGTEADSIDRCRDRLHKRNLPANVSIAQLRAFFVYGLVPLFKYLQLAVAASVRTLWTRTFLGEQMYEILKIAAGRSHLLRTYE